MITNWNVENGYRDCKATRAKFTLAEWIPPDEGGAKCWSLSLLSPTENQVFSLSLSLSKASLDRYLQGSFFLPVDGRAHNA